MTRQQKIYEFPRTTGDANGNAIGMDELTYAYQSGNGNSNLLLNVRDAVSNQNTGGFVDGNTNPALNDYEYDVNDFRVKKIENLFCEESERSSMIKDRNKGIENITYNHLNLPTKITWANNKYIAYQYNAAGQKIRKTVEYTDSLKIVDYLDGFQSRKLSGTGNVLQFFLPIAIGTNGYVKATPLTRTNTSFAFNYIYNYTDHLDERIQSAALDEVCERSSVRISYTKDPITKALKIVDEDHYYPFGLKHGVYTAATLKDFRIDEMRTNGGIGGGMGEVALINVTKTEYQYKYQGQERQDELGLNWDSFKWRNYDYAIGRFMSLDPLSEDYAEQSPYAFCQNSPVAYMELEGLEGVLAIFYHGGPTGGGLPTTVDKAGYTGQYFSNTQSTAMTNSRDFAGTIIAPGLTSASGVESGMSFVNENYSEGDQVIIYVYSYGVDVAVDLATALNDVGVPVDLLVTVDGSDGPLQNTTVNTTIPENVSTNLNVYQTENSGASTHSRVIGSSSGMTSSSSGSNSSGSSNRSQSGSSNFPGSSGGPNKAADSSKTNVINKNVSGSGVNHGNIQGQSKDIIQPKIDSKIVNYPTN